MRDCVFYSTCLLVRCLPEASRTFPLLHKYVTSQALASYWIAGCHSGFVGLVAPGDQARLPVCLLYIFTVRVASMVATVLGPSEFFMGFARVLHQIIFPSAGPPPPRSVYAENHPLGFWGTLPQASSWTNISLDYSLHSIHFNH